MSAKPAPQPVTEPVEAFDVVDGCLMVGGVPLPRLAERAGRARVRAPSPLSSPCSWRATIIMSR